jgi:hypothetical protein
VDFIRPRYCWTREQGNFPESSNDREFCLPILFYGDLEREWIPVSRISKFSKADPKFRAGDDEFIRAYRMMKEDQYISSQIDGHGRAAGWRSNLENTMPTEWRVMLRRVRRKVSRSQSGYKA